MNSPPVAVAAASSSSSTAQVLPDQTRVSSTFASPLPPSAVVPWSGPPPAVLGNVAYDNLARAARLDGVNGAHSLGYNAACALPADETNTGLVNLGNTCYGNALLFALSKVPRVRRWLQEHARLAADASVSHDRHCMLCALAADIRVLTTAQSGVPFPPRVMQRRGEWNRAFANRAQQDAHEAFVTLLQYCDRIDVAALRMHADCRTMSEEDYNISSHAYSTPFWQTFGNLQLVNTSCTACNYMSVSYERAHALALDLSPSPGDNVSTLLRTYLAPEALDAHFRCDSCGERGHGVKQNRVLYWPPVLAVSLKRFTFDPTTLTPQKIMYHVRFDMTLHGFSDTPYQLRALIEHRGETLRSGHYVAYVRTDAGDWYLCNDSASRELLVENDVLQRRAYMLIYERLL